MSTGWSTTVTTMHQKFFNVTSLLFHVSASLYHCKSSQWRIFALQSSPNENVCIAVGSWFRLKLNDPSRYSIDSARAGK
jgi:hypothetical protein